MRTKVPFPPDWGDIQRDIEKEYELIKELEENNADKEPVR